MLNIICFRTVASSSLRPKPATGMELEVKHCPESYKDKFGTERPMFTARPKKSIKKINAEVRKQADAMIAKAKATVSAGEAA